MIPGKALQITTPSDCEIAITRVFDAPRLEVFNAFSNPALLKRWFGPRGWSLRVCVVDFRVGGEFRFMLRGPDGQDTGMRGTYLEIDAPAHTRHLETYDGYPGESLVSTTLIETDARTILEITIRYQSREYRDAVIGSDPEYGLAESYDRLAELLTAP